ncbi:MAG: hypothetical protein CR985_02320 [Flavobacteriales bacterium]|nr:MAG: hypothetical protein CR985_02320 [Flavobacteriales bacterium]
MKLVILTVVDEFEKQIIELLKEAGIENYSESQIDGYKNSTSVLESSNWFSGEIGGVKSRMFFSFNTSDKIDKLCERVEEFNQNLETNNPVRLVVVPIEKFI